jgi:type I site-specific restriction endonuclease
VSTQLKSNNDNGDDDDDDNNNNNNNKPVIIRATGTISKSFRKYMSTIPGNHDVRKIQKTAILGTAHILRKVLI